MNRKHWKIFSLYFCLLIPMNACLGLYSEYPMAGVQSETAGSCTQDYEGELTMISEASGFDAQEDGVSIIGDRSTLQYWNNVGRQYDAHTYLDNGDTYRFYRGEQIQYEGDYEASAIDDLVSTYHVYGNISENEWFAFEFDVLVFQDALDPESVDADIFSLEIFQVQESYEPASCESNDECTARTQSATYSIDSVTITELDSDVQDVTVVFVLDTVSTEHYPESVTVTLQAEVDEQSGADVHPDISYTCQSDYTLYIGSVSGSCAAGYTDVDHIELTDGRLSQECYDCVVARDGVEAEDDEGGYALDTYSDDVLGIIQECTIGLSNSFESSGNLE